MSLRNIHVFSQYISSVQLVLQKVGEALCILWPLGILWWSLDEILYWSEWELLFPLWISSISSYYRHWRKQSQGWMK